MLAWLWLLDWLSFLWLLSSDQWSKTPGRLWSSGGWWRQSHQSLPRQAYHFSQMRSPLLRSRHRTESRFRGERLSWWHWFGCRLSSCRGDTWEGCRFRRKRREMREPATLSQREWKPRKRREPFFWRGSGCGSAWPGSGIRSWSSCKFSCSACKWETDGSRVKREDERALSSNRTEAERTEQRTTQKDQTRHSIPLTRKKAESETHLLTHWRLSRANRNTYRKASKYSRMK